MHNFVAYSDHVPIILSLLDEMPQRPRHRVFKLEAMWINSSDCLSIIKNAWTCSSDQVDLHDIMRKIKCCSGNLEAFPLAFSHIYITLILKKKCPEQVSDYRPISMCNVLNKIVAKVLTNILRMIMPKLISNTQSAFILGCQIKDNVLVAYELMHHLNLKKRGKIGFMSLKPDMSKTYDRVEWNFLETVMTKLGFCDN